MSSISVREYDSEPSKTLGNEGPFSGVEYTIDLTSGAIDSPPPCRQWAGVREFFAAPRRLFVSLFLPIGYPASVGEGYLRYQVYDSIQGLCSYLRGVVSTSAVLVAAGVGDAEATAASAAATWALRDGMGMVGGLLFAYVAAHWFDAAVKEFRLFADVINDVGLTLDMLVPLARQDRALYVASVATACKAMCGVAAGATKGSITHHFAIRGNMADLTAKESTQETLVSLLGMVGGLCLARYLHWLEDRGCVRSSAGQKAEPCHASKTVACVSWAIFAFLTIVHVWANYQAVALLRLRTLNRGRSEVAFREIIDHCAGCCVRSLAKEKVSARGDPKQARNAEVVTLVGRIPPPERVSESLVVSAWKLFRPGIGLGVRLRDAVRGVAAAQAATTLDTDKKYAVFLSRHGSVNVTLAVGAAEIDKLLSLLHALLITNVLNQGKFDDEDVLSVTHKCMDEISEHLRLQTLADLGWDCHRMHLGHGSWRIEVNDPKHLKMS